MVARTKRIVTRIFRMVKRIVRIVNKMVKIVGRIVRIVTSMVNRHSNCIQESLDNIIRRFLALARHSGYIQDTFRRHPIYIQTLMKHSYFIMKLITHAPCITVHALCKPHGCPVHTLCTPVHALCRAHAQGMQAQCPMHSLRTLCEHFVHCAYPMHAPCTTCSLSMNAL